MKSELLINREDILSTEAEERYRFIRQNFIAIGLDTPANPISEILPENFSEFDLEKKIKFRKLCQDYQLTLQERDGGFILYLNQEQIAEWKKPYYELRTDPNALTVSKRLYVAMHLEFYSLLIPEIINP